MEKNENSSMKCMENRQSSNNGRLIVSNESKDESAVELSCKKSCLVSHATEGCSANLGNTAATSGNNSHKMGSRRIFTPQFKLQVLESYRNDNDCKGNQRATARKYNIHRRQIQKWLQCESSLRSSVANINQNTVKHQFHNISIHQQQQTQKSSIPSASLISVPFGASNQHSHLGLEQAAAARSEAPHNAIIVPSLSTGVTTSSTQTQGVFSAVNLAAVVAAAAGAAMTITSPPSNGTSLTTESVSSPLRPPSIVRANSNVAAAMSPLLHHHHYGIPPYIHTPASVQLPVPILTHHISHPQHIHQQAQQHQSYQYHNLAYRQALTHQSDKQQPSFLSTISLPDVNALSTAASLSTGNGVSVGETELTDSVESLHSNAKRNSENMLNDSSTDQNHDHNIAYQCHQFNGVNHPKAVNTPMYQYKEGGYTPLLYPLGPMDLSLRTRRNEKAELNSTSTSGKDITQRMAAENEPSSIVDLTHRKRKVSSPYNNADECQTSFSEKQLKLKNTTEDSTFVTNSNSDEDEIEIEVGTEDKLPPSKPVKLFKPYLLDEEDADSSSVSRSTEIKYGESSEASPWIRFTTSLSPPPHSYDNSAGPCQGTFQYSLKDNHFTSPIENANISSEATKVENTKSAFTSIPTISPSSFCCPKGSPSSSGYESSSSTYSDSSFSSRGESYAYSRTYSLTLQMHANHNDNIILHPSKHVERWLEQEARTASGPNSPIAILA